MPSMKSIVLKRVYPFFISGIVLWLGACSQKETVTPQQTQQATTTALDNSQIVAVTKEVLDLTQSGLASEGLIEVAPELSDPNARKSRGCRPMVTSQYTLITRTADTLAYSGTLTIDYGDGTICSDSVQVRKGRITDLFTVVIVGKAKTGVKPSISHQETITFENFQKDSATINGTFVKQVTNGVTTVTAQNVKITYLDGTSVTWGGTLTYTHDNAGTTQNWTDDTQRISGAITGTTREGTAYTASIVKDITYSVSCLNEDVNGPVSGTIEISSGGTTSVVDYGDGTCDNIYTVTINGVTTEYTFN